jgi:hypothetical protein
MEKSRQKVPDASSSAYGKGEPFNRVFGPKVKTEPEVILPGRPGPDPGLRRDLESRSNPANETAEIPGSSLRLRVRPEFASVSIDGIFVATGRELASMEGPLAITAGKHDVVVSASGYIGASEVIELVEDKVLELEIFLSEKRTD